MNTKSEFSIEQMYTSAIQDAVGAIKREKNGRPWRQVANEHWRRLLFDFGKGIGVLAPDLSFEAFAQDDVEVISNGVNIPEDRFLGAVGAAYRIKTGVWLQKERE